MPEKAIAHLLTRIADDPRLAYYLDPMSRSMELLTEAYATLKGLSVEEFRGQYYPRLKFEAPKCRNCAEIQEAMKP